nr:protein tpr3 [Quercus suber]
MALQASLANDYTTSVNCVMRSPNGALSGVAYSKHIVPRYPIMVVMICGTTWRLTLKWLVSHASARALGSRYYSVHLFYTLAKLAGGLCINQNKVYQKVLRGQSCTTMAYSADGTRLFSCGTSEEGESYFAE